jgi:hypothetical protein
MVVMVFEDMAKDLDPAEVFGWTGKFDPEEGARKLRRASMSVLVALDVFSKPLPDDAAFHDTMAMSVGLPTGKSYRLIQSSLLAAEMLMRANTKNGMVVMLTERGKQAAKKLKDILEAEMKQQYGGDE